jgi:uncharacterized protein (DUF1499 family)
MRRHLIIEEPPSRMAHASFWLALFAYAVAAITRVMVRGDLIEAVPGAVAMGSAAALAGLAVLLAIWAFVVIWVNGNPGFGRALFGFVFGLALAAYPAYLGYQGLRLPMLADVSTDTDDPPQFELVARLRPSSANPVAYPGAAAAEKQKQGYPDIEPIPVAASARDAYDTALDVVTRRGWTIVDARPPTAARREGRIEAVARTFLMGFRDDVVVRGRPTAEGAVIDIRSASRYGRHDLGSNASRIRSLGAEIEDELGVQPAAR